ncbi:hypothetical protein [Bacillus sp. V33-4]|uniref:hypothetical protein n=1 Tax=Bacillus sp. V33-4 TaxID=2054169 RepID=UPI00115BDE01|nr:hypothetical protein [Bacillus sp. V33-4]
MADALDARSRNGAIGLASMPSVYESVLPFWKMTDGLLDELILYPLELGYHLPRYNRGWPKLSYNQDILQGLKDLSESYGTEITIENGIGRVKI